MCKVSFEYIHITLRIMPRKNDTDGKESASDKYEALAKALIATPQFKEELSKISTIDDLLGKNGMIAGMLKPVIEELLQAEMSEHVGYEKHDPKGYLSGNSRNGSYKRTLRSSDGIFDIDMPRDRVGSFEPKAVVPYKQISTELEQKIISLYAHGSSTRDIIEFLDETYGIPLSEGFISQVTEKILGLAKEWQQRSLQSIYAIAYMDAIHVKCRESGKVINKAVHIVMAYDLEGRKDILGHYISHGAEGSKFWLSVITDLKNRGVSDILIACTDGLSGFEQAIHSSFPQTTVQRCVVHAIRNALAYIPHKLKSEFMEYLKPVYQANTKSEAETAFTILENRYIEKYPMAVNIWKRHFEALTQYFAFSPEIRKMIYTTNAIESYNSVLRKYTKNKRSFVNDDALAKVLYLATQKAQEHWDKCIPNWPTILNQFAIHFEGRIPMP